MKLYNQHSYSITMSTSLTTDSALSNLMKKAVPFYYTPNSITTKAPKPPSLFFPSVSTPYGRMVNRNTSHQPDNPNLISLVAQFLLVHDQSNPPEIPGKDPPEFPRNPDYTPASIPPEVPEFPKVPEIETSPPEVMEPPNIPEVPTPGPDFPVPPPPCPPTPPDVPPPPLDAPLRAPPNRLPSRLLPDPDILPPRTHPRADIQPPPGPYVSFVF